MIPKPYKGQKNEVTKIKHLIEEQIMKKKIKSLILCLILGFSLIASPVFATKVKPINESRWDRCLNSFHIIYETIFATTDREWIQYIYNKYGKPEPAKIVGGINGEDLIDIVSDAIGYEYPRGPLWIRSDHTYRLTTIEEMKRFLQFDDTDKLIYIPEYRDCDDFARLLRARVERWTPGLAFGYIHILNGSHAVNVFIDVNHDVWYIEPGTDFVKPLEADDDLSFIFLGEDDTKSVQRPKIKRR